LGFHFFHPRPRVAKDIDLKIDYRCDSPSGNFDEVTFLRVEKMITKTERLYVLLWNLGDSYKVSIHRGNDPYSLSKRLVLKEFGDAQTALVLWP
jgi:hypothetical protein